jgi:hypothetical protein
MLFNIRGNGVYFNFGNASRVIPDTDVDTSEPSRRTTGIHKGTGLQILSSLVSNILYLHRMWAEGCARIKVKYIPSILRRSKY